MILTYRLENHDIYYIYYIKAAEETKSKIIHWLSSVFRKKSAKSAVNSDIWKQFEFTADCGCFLKKIT